MCSLVTVGVALTIAPTSLLGSYLAVPLRVDRYGDPFPAHPIARLGTIRFRHGDRPSSLAFSRDGKTFATSHSASILLWDLRSGAMLRQYQIPEPKPGFGTPYVTCFVGPL